MYGSAGLLRRRRRHRRAFCAAAEQRRRRRASRDALHRAPRRRDAHVEAAAPSVSTSEKKRRRASRPAAGRAPCRRARRARGSARSPAAPSRSTRGASAFTGSPSIDRRTRAARRRSRRGPTIVPSGPEMRCSSSCTMSSGGGSPSGSGVAVFGGLSSRPEEARRSSLCVARPKSIPVSPRHGSIANLSTVATRNAGSSR